jgi:hypothetical protein
VFPPEPILGMKGPLDLALMCFPPISSRCALRFDREEGGNGGYLHERLQNLGGDSASSAGSTCWYGLPLLTEG